MPDPLAVIVDRLNQSGVRYMVTGSVASTIYGEPRLTQDIDIVLSLARGDAERLVAAFPSRDFYVPPVEVVAEEGSRPSGGHFNLLHLDTGLRADCYVAGESELNHWGMDHRRSERVGSVAIWLAPPEYVILYKLSYAKQGGGEKHLEDIAKMLRVSGSQIRHADVSVWVSRLGLDAEWRLAQDLFTRRRELP